VARIARIGRAGQGGQVIERTTITTTKANGDTVTKSHEKYARGEWQADAWALERRDGENYASNRQEIKELRASLSALLKAVKAGKLTTSDSSIGNAVTPRVGGDADPESI